LPVDPEFSSHEVDPVDGYPEGFALAEAGAHSEKDSGA
jgi:hypothetical protein